MTAPENDWLLGALTSSAVDGVRPGRQKLPNDGRRELVAYLILSDELEQKALPGRRWDATKGAGCMTGYETLGYDKDADVSVLLSTCGDKATAMRVAVDTWMPLARDGHVRNLGGRLSLEKGEPFDWLVVRDKATGKETVIPFAG